jgi:hypothetical protein
MEITFKKTFTPVTLTINSAVDLATVLGALIGYGTATLYAENNLKAIGLGEFYSGNVRKGARQIVGQIAKQVGLDTAALEEIVGTYTSSDKFSSSKASKAGSAVIGTAADLAPGYEPTSFESGEETNIESDDDLSYVSDDEDFLGD